MEERIELKTFRVKLTCDKCNNGQMENTGYGVTIGSRNTLWRHKCTNCENTKEYEESYPTIVYEEIKKD